MRTRTSFCLPAFIVCAAEETCCDETRLGDHKQPGSLPSTSQSNKHSQRSEFCTNNYHPSLRLLHPRPKRATATR